MDFYVVMGRAGFRVARKKQKNGRVGRPHKITKDETVSWFKKRVSYNLLIALSVVLTNITRFFFIVRRYCLEQVNFLKCRCEGLLVERLVCCTARTSIKIK
jgi:hypothetical protein